MLAVFSRIKLLALITQPVVMGGKKATPKDAASKPAPKKGVKKDPEDAAQLKKDQSNMVTQLKQGDTPEKVETLELYKSLPRFSQEKVDLLKKWKLDRTCKWIGSYKESRSFTSKTTKSEKEGYATKYLGS